MRNWQLESVRAVVERTPPTGFQIGIDDREGNSVSVLQTCHIERLVARNVREVACTESGHECEIADCEGKCVCTWWRQVCMVEKRCSAQLV